jgi:hypothetical protein
VAAKPTLNNTSSASSAMSTFALMMVPLVVLVVDRWDVASPQTGDDSSGYSYLLGGRGENDMRIAV